ncbi:MAG: DUF1854 domain-containing protein [Phycisphaerae bacterium]
MDSPKETARTRATGKLTSDRPDYSQARLVDLQRNAAGQLVARLAGRDEPIVDVQVARCFPWSMPDQYICLRDADGYEIVMFHELDEVDGSLRELIEHEMREKIFNPRILEVLEFEHKFGVSNIKARTDRGVVNFQVKSRDDVRLLSASRALFRDADGNIYELPDLNQLDSQSRRHLANYF